MNDRYLSKQYLSRRRLRRRAAFDFRHAETDIHAKGFDVLHLSLLANRLFQYCSFPTPSASTMNDIGLPYELLHFKIRYTILHIDI